MRQARYALGLGVATALLAAMTGCGSDETGGRSRSALADDAITVGSFDFVESMVIAEVYAQALEAAGFEVRRAFALGPREFVGPALHAGMVELVPEYAGTAAEFHSRGAATPTENVATTHAELVAAVGSDDIVVLDPAPAQDANTFVVTRTTTRRLGLDSLSDLTPFADGLAFGGPAECPARDHCLAGLGDVYGLEFREFVVLDAGGPLTLQALREGHVDVALMFSTDPTIAEEDLVVLADDLDLQPAENITPLMRAEVIDRWGAGPAEAIDRVSARLTTSEVRRLNAAALVPDADMAGIAAAWLSEVSS